MATRRDFLVLIKAAGLSAAGLSLIGHAALAAPAVVEVLAMAHWPVQNALKPVRAVLAKYEGRVRVVDMDIESPDGEKRAKAVGMKGHIPVILLINGSKSFKRDDGKTIEFVNFPVASGSPMGLNGTWSVADFEAALRAALGEKAQ
jgi:hypothetical protein